MIMSIEERGFRRKGHDLNHSSLEFELDLHSHHLQDGIGFCIKIPNHPLWKAIVITVLYPTYSI